MCHKKDGLLKWRQNKKKKQRKSRFNVGRQYLQGRKEFISNFGVKYILILMYSKKILNRGRK